MKGKLKYRLICKLIGHDIQVYDERKTENGYFIACGRCSKVSTSKPVDIKPKTDYDKVLKRNGHI